MYYVAKKELTAFPLDKLYEEVTEAGRAAVASIMEEAREMHDRNVQQRIEAIYSSREDSYEGNVEEDYPFKPPEDEYIKKLSADAKKVAAGLFCEKYDLKGNAAWLLPQLSAHIAKMDTKGLNSLEYAASFGIDDFHKGLYTLAKHPLRGDLISKQYSVEVRSYCALVPLLLMPHKKFNGVKYSAWSKEGLSMLIDSNLYAAMTCGYAPTNTIPELLSIRQKGLTVATGKRKDEIRSAQTTHKVYFLSGDLKALPWLAQVMLFQIWCAHPANRTDLMILDWNNWDSMPEALISTEVIPSVKKVSAKVSYNDPMPWEM